MHYDTTQYRNVQAKGGFEPVVSRSGFPGPPGDIERHCRAGQYSMGSFLAKAEALLADSLKRVSPNDIAHDAQPTPPSTTRSPSP